MSSVGDRAFAAAAERGYGGAETRVLLRMAFDADHDSGENCTTSLARLHEAAGYADDAALRTVRRTVKRLEADATIRCDINAPGIGRLFTVCPVAPWSGAVTSRTALGRKLSVWQRRNGTPDVQTSGVSPNGTPDSQVSGANPPTPDTTPDTTPDSQVSGDQRTNGPTTPLSPLTEARDEGQERDGEPETQDFAGPLAPRLSMDRASRRRGR